MGKKASATATSKPSSASAPTTSSNPQSANKSSILRSSFAPSALQLHLFASVIQSFDSQQLRIHDTDTGKLRQQHATRSGNTITCLDWGYYGSLHKVNGEVGNNKKRRRAPNTAENVVVAYGTTASDICMYSPVEGRLVGTLSGAHNGGIKDFKFSVANNHEAWSIGGDGKLIQWDLSKNLVVRKTSLPDTAISLLSSPSQHEPQILCASATPFSIYPTEDFRIDTFDSFRGQVRNLQRSISESSNSRNFFLAADDDRYINVFDIGTRKLATTLVTGSAVEQLDLSSPSATQDSSNEQLLAVVTRDGTVELFLRPFDLPVVVNGDLKSTRKAMTRKANSKIQVTNANSSHAKVFAAAIQGPELLIVTIDGGVDPAFQKVRWQDDVSSELLFQGVKKILKVRSSSTLNTAQTNGVKDMGKTHMDESRTVVVNGTDGFDLPDAESDNSSGGEDEDAETDNGSTTEPNKQADEETSGSSDEELEQPEAVNGVVKTHVLADTEMEDVKDKEPTFGDLLAFRHPNTIAIADSFRPEKPKLDASKQLAVPTGMSLGTVLTQALRTNDTNLLESCLHANDAGIIQNTIQRLDSVLAANLLSKLAERLASRPGRYGHLLSWVQWTCIAHGGAIAGQKNVANKIKTLYRVLAQRSKSLDKLLLLKGKLDMLDAQLTFRQQTQVEGSAQDRHPGEPGMIYIEGEENNWSSEEDVDEAVGVTKTKKATKQKRRALEDLIDEQDNDSEMPTMNGIGSVGSGEESDEEPSVTGRAAEGSPDVEADISSEGDVSENEEGSDDVNDTEEDEEDEDDSSMDDFINDGEISHASDEDDIDIDDEPQASKPERKRSKYV